jgi:endo-1,4-beta-xylanase
MLKQFTYHDVDYRGRIDRVYYTHRDAEGKTWEKYANIYLPWGYDADAGKKYDTLYLMHGGSGNADAWLDSCHIKNMLDCCFNEKAAEPFIVVFPSYYKNVAGKVDLSRMEGERQMVRDFASEAATELIPAVESHIRGWAESVDDEGLRASRAHRAFGGFSMGSVTTWFEFLLNLPYIATFLPLSGDCWAEEIMGGNTKPKETAELLARAAEAALAKGYDFRIFAATGSEDPASGNMVRQIEEMKRLKPFEFSEDLTAGNFHYKVAEGAVHAYECVFNYVYSYLPYIFD